MRLAVDMHDLAFGLRNHHCCISDGACIQCGHSGSRCCSIRIDERGVVRKLELRHDGRTLAHAKHTTTSPRYPQWNGLIERQVRMVKGVIHKCAKTGNDMLIALQQHRCTPLDSNLSSHSEILVNRPIHTTLPSHHPMLMHQNQQQTNEQLQQRRDRMIRDHDKRAGPELPALHAGQRVRILNKETHHWSPGEIVDKCTEPRTYVVQTPNGTRLRRTRSHLRELQAENILSEATEHTRRRVTFREDNTDEQQMAPPVTTSGEPPPDEAMPLSPATRRSGRMIRKPSRFQEKRSICVSGIYSNGLIVLAAYSPFGDRQRTSSCYTMTVDTNYKHAAYEL